MRIVRAIAERAPSSFEYEVIPGITSIQALAAKHGVPINDIGSAVHITTGRRLAAEGLPADVSNAVVMLDGHCTFTSVADAGLDIYWGAYLGTPDEALFSGPLTGELATEISRVHDDSRRAKGWIMSTYLLTRR